MRHKWTEEDDKKALYAYRFCDKEETKRMADKLPMTYASFKKRIANFRHLKEGGGLSHYTNQSKAI